MRRILVTGAASRVGGSLVRTLEQRSDTEILAVDEIPPAVAFHSPFRQTSLDSLEFAHWLLERTPETIVHLQTLDRAAALGAERARTAVVLGSQALFGVIGRDEGVRTVIVKSDAAVYGSGPRSPSIVNETSAPAVDRSRYSRSLKEVEESVTGLARDVPGTSFTVLRFGQIVGAELDNAISRFLRLRTVPHLLGFDPRLHLLHLDDAVSALLHLVDRPVAGTFNIAAEGPMYLSRVLRLGGRRSVALLESQLDAAYRAMAGSGLRMPSHLRRLLQHGRVLDTTRMVRTLGFVPGYDGRGAVHSLYDAVPRRAAG